MQVPSQRSLGLVDEPPGHERFDAPDEQLVPGDVAAIFVSEIVGFPLHHVFKPRRLEADPAERSGWLEQPGKGTESLKDFIVALGLDDCDGPTNDLRHPIRGSLVGGGFDQAE